MLIRKSISIYMELTPACFKSMKTEIQKELEQVKDQLLSSLNFK